MGHEQAFLEDIRQNPDDDTPRRVFADWLEEHGQGERAEFIRLQVRLASGAHAGRTRDEVRVRALLKKHGAKWAGSLADMVAAYEYRRGFIEHVRLDTKTFVTRGEEIFPLAPVRSVLLDSLDDTARAKELAACPHLCYVESLSFAPSSWQQFYANDPCFEALMQSPHLTRLTALAVPRHGLRSEAIRALLSWSGLKSLKSLNLSRNAIGISGAQALSGSPAVRGLVALVLSGNVLLAGGAEVLAGSPHLTALQTLRLARCRFGATGVRALVASPGLSLILAEVTLLDLSRNALSIRGTQALARSARVGQLKTLMLARNRMQDNGAIALAEPSHLAQLTALDLRGNRIGTGGAHALATSSGLGGLVELNLSANLIDEAGAAALGAREKLVQLKRLDLRSNRLSPAERAGLRKKWGKNFGRL